MPRDFQHFKGNNLTRSEKVQRFLTELIITSIIPDNKRETSKVWELRHSSGVTVIGRILAQKRGLDVEIAEIICILHDISSIIKGTYKNHAKIGAEIAEKYITATGDFSLKEIGLIVDAIANHSDKHIYSTSPYIELIKDADVFECSLYENSELGYKLHKSKEIFDANIKRIEKVRMELGLPANPVFRS